MKEKTRLNYKTTTACYYFIAFVFVCLFNTNPSYSKIEINIDNGISEALPVAISEFDGQNLDSIEFGAKIRDVLVNDLENSGLFRVIDNEAFLELPSISKTPIFTNWRTINANMLLVTKVNLDRQNNFVDVSYKLYDVFKEKEVESGDYKIVIDGWMKVIKN
jgi:TolB protein